MRRAAPLLALLVPVLLLAPASAQAAEPEPLATGLNTPVDLTFDPEGRLYFAELDTGNVTHLHPDGSTSGPVAHVPASAGGNGGFTGITADPDQPDLLYAYYSMEKSGAENGKINRVVRLDLDTGNETVLLDDIRWAELHNGGRLVVGPDGYLYVTVGENGLKDPAQDEGSILGKILRMTRDGDPAPGNPDGWHPLAYAKGWRNPFGITVAPNGTLYVSDNGGMEEVNRLEKGGNYGWPACSGPCDDESTVQPTASWGEHFGPTGVTVHNGILYLGDFAGQQVRTVDLATGETGVHWRGGDMPVLDVEVGPNECLYIATWNAVYRAPLGDAACGLPGGDAHGDDSSLDFREDAGGAGWLPVPAPAVATVLALSVLAARLGRRRREA